MILREKMSKVGQIQADLKNETHININLAIKERINHWLYIRVNFIKQKNGGRKN